MTNVKKTKLADEYLELKAQQAALAEKEERIKRELIRLNGSEFEGKLGRVLISEVDGRTTFDSDLLKQHVPAATLALCQKTGKKSLRFSVSARKAKLSLIKAA